MFSSRVTEDRDGLSHSEVGGWVTRVPGVGVGWGLEQSRRDWYHQRGGAHRKPRDEQKDAQESPRLDRCYRCHLHPWPCSSRIRVPNLDSTKEYFIIFGVMFFENWKATYLKFFSQNIHDIKTCHSI